MAVDQILGHCALGTCREPVLASDESDRESRSAQGRTYTLLYHRACNPRADHDKDGPR